MFEEVKRAIAHFALVAPFKRATGANRSHRLFQKSDKSDLLMSFFCKVQRERFALGCSFYKEMRANHSQSLFKKSDFEQKSEHQKREFPTLSQTQKRFISLQNAYYSNFTHKKYF